MSSKLKYLVLHCTATREGKIVTSDMIRAWHTSPPPKGRGWKQVGYSSMFHLDGTLENLVFYDNNDFVDSYEITNGALGINGVSRHIVYVGGVDAAGRPKDTRTDRQLMSMEIFIKGFILEYPHIEVAGHNHFDNKACPSFNVPEWLRKIGVQEKNIFKNTKFG